MHEGVSEAQHSQVPRFLSQNLVVGNPVLASPKWHIGSILQIKPSQHSSLPDLGAPLNRKYTTDYMRASLPRNLHPLDEREGME